jgi:hypothetical protein
MEFVIDQSRFLSALALAQTVADRRGTMPVLANVLLKVDKRGVECRATDMLIAVSERIDAEVVSTGSLTLGVRHLHGVVKTLVEGPVRVRGLDNHWAEIVAGRSEFKLMGMSEADFPTLPDPHDLQLVELPVHAFGDLLTKTLFSVSTDEARANLNGALLECDGKTATMVSTDGHRLTKYTVPLAGPRLTTGVIVPRKGMVEIKRVLDRAQAVRLSDRHARPPASDPATCPPFGPQPPPAGLRPDDVSAFRTATPARRPPTRRRVRLSDRNPRPPASAPTTCPPFGPQPSPAGLRSDDLPPSGPPRRLPGRPGDAAPPRPGRSADRRQAPPHATASRIGRRRPVWLSPNTSWSACTPVRRGVPGRPTWRGSGPDSSGRFRMPSPVCACPTMSTSSPARDSARG